MMFKYFTLIVVFGLIAAIPGTAEVSVTVYNSNLGVVGETRELEFDKGIGRLAFRDVPARIDPASVRFELVDQGKNVSILEQNYIFDLVSPEKLYAKYIDHRIELTDKEGNLYSGDLLAFSSGAVTLRDNSGRIKIISLANILETNFPELPEGLITRPTLFWLYQSDYSGTLDCQVGYQTSGLNWEAEYVGLLDEKETELDLSGWASIDNTSGKTYTDARLKLIAGDIHRVRPIVRGGRTQELMAAAPKGFEEKAFFEYHMYTLPRRATLADNEKKQLSLFEPATTKITKKYLYQPERNRTDVLVKIELQNSTASGLGIPLPAGRVRLFKADADGALILLGEDRIDHTPQGEEVSLTVGTAFDIVAEEKMTSATRLSKKVEERQYEIELKNHKTEDVTIEVEKQFYGFWELAATSLEYTKKDARTVVFQVPVKADSEVTLSFKVRITNR